MTTSVACSFSPRNSEHALVNNPTGRVDQSYQDIATTASAERIYRSMAEVNGAFLHTCAPLVPHDESIDWGCTRCRSKARLLMKPGIRRSTTATLGASWHEALNTSNWAHSKTGSRWNSYVYDNLARPGYRFPLSLATMTSATPRPIQSILALQATNSSNHSLRPYGVEERFLRSFRNDVSPIERPT